MPQNFSSSIIHWSQNFLPTAEPWFMTKTITWTKVDFLFLCFSNYQITTKTSLEIGLIYLSSWPCVPASVLCYFLQHVLPFHRITLIVIQTSRLALTSFQAARAASSLVLSADWLPSQFRGERLQVTSPSHSQICGWHDKRSQQVFLPPAPPSIP